MAIRALQEYAEGANPTAERKELSHWGCDLPEHEAVPSHACRRKAPDCQGIGPPSGRKGGYQLGHPGHHRRNHQRLCAEEILQSIGQAGGFSKRGFFRGIVLPPWLPTTEAGTLPGHSPSGDVIIEEGVWQKGRTIFDCIDFMKEGDVILKGANALDLARRQAGVLIGHPRGGTAGAALQAAAGRRVRLILPVGLEKRICGDLMDLATRLNLPGAQGPRLLPLPGEIFTEIDAISLLAGAKAELVAGGGVGGAEGSVRLAIEGSKEEMRVAEELMVAVAAEPGFEL